MIAMNIKKYVLKDENGLMRFYIIIFPSPKTSQSLKSVSWRAFFIPGCNIYYNLISLDLR